MKATPLGTDSKAAANTGLAKVAVQCSADTFVVNQSLVLRINICGENRHLRQARKRCSKCEASAAPRTSHNCGFAKLQKKFLCFAKIFFATSQTRQPLCAILEKPEKYLIFAPKNYYELLDRVEY
jgi:hypothetical protein